MKKRFIVKPLALFSLLLAAACQQKPAADHHDIGKVEVDSALAALINPTDEKIVARVSTLAPQERAGAMLVEVQGVVNYDSRNEQYISSRVAGRIERLYVKYNYQPIKKGQLLMEVYAPDLAAAQQDLLYLAQHQEDVALLQKAKQRLLLLGMSKASIETVLRTQKVNYRIPVYSAYDGFVVENTAVAAAAPVAKPTESATSMDGMGMANTSSTAANVAVVENTPVSVVEGQYVNAGQGLFKVYQSKNVVAEFAIKPDLLPFVKKGQKLALYNASDREDTFATAAVALLQPVVKNGEAFTLAKVALGKQQFRVGELLIAKIPVVVAKSFWLPSSAVTTMGNEAVVFKTEAGVFTPQKVKLGINLGGEVQVLTNLAGWKVAKDAAYLVDSESFIQVK